MLPSFSDVHRHHLASGCLSDWGPRQAPHAEVQPFHHCSRTVGSHQSSPVQSGRVRGTARSMHLRARGDWDRGCGPLQEIWVPGLDKDRRRRGWAEELRLKRKTGEASSRGA